MFIYSVVRSGVVIEANSTSYLRNNCSHRRLATTNRSKIYNDKVCGLYYFIYSSIFVNVIRAHSTVL